MITIGAGLDVELKWILNSWPNTGSGNKDNHGQIYLTLSYGKVIPHTMIGQFAVHSLQYGPKIKLVSPSLAK